MLDKDARIKGTFDFYMMDKDEDEFMSTMDMLVKTL